MPSAALVQWKRWICSRSAARNMKCSSLVVFCSCRGQASALPDAQRTYPASLPDRHVLRGEYCRTNVSRSGHPFGELGVLQCTFAVGAPEWECQDLVIGYLVPHAVCYEQHSVAVATSARCGTAIMLFLASLAGTADARCFAAIHAAQPQKPPGHHARSSLTYRNLAGPSKISTANMAGGHRSVFTAETMWWGALACRRPVVHKVADGFPPTHRAWDPRSLWPSPQSSSTWSPSRWRLYPTTTAHRSSARGPRPAPKLQTLLATPGDAEAPTEWAVTMSESSALEEDPPTGQANTRRNFVRDKRPPRGRPCGSDCSSRCRHFEVDGTTTENGCKRPAVAASSCPRHAT